MSTKKIQILGSVLTTDETLTQSGIAADAKVVGEALAGKQPIGDYALKSELENLGTTVAEQISGAVEAITPDDIGAAAAEHAHDEYALKDDIAQPDWNQNDENAADYVKNRTHYVESVEEIVNLPEATLELLDGSSDEFAITTPFLAPIEVDTTYSIVYNGSEYECKAQSIAVGTDTATVLGNIGAQTGGTDTGEPFIVVVVPDERVSEIGYYAMVEVSDGAEAITVSISTTKEIVKTIDPKYLAEGADGHKQLVTDAVGNAKWTDKTHYVEKVEETIVVPETTLTLDEYGDMYLTEPLSSSIELNESYTIIYNGTEYTCFVQEFTMDAITAYVLGNIGKAFGEGADTGEPFVFIVIPSDIAAEEGVYGQLESFDGAETVVLEIIHKDEKVKTLDPKYLANSVGEYKQLVTDAEGNTVWEDRLAWSESGVTVVPETTYTLENGGANIATPFLTPLVIGREYKVIYNGTTYISSAIEMVEDGMTGKLLGNFSLVTGTGDTGEPFIIIEFPAEQTVESGFYWAIADIGGTGTEVTLSITETDIVHKIPVKYLGTPNWNASKGENGYIENRTHYINQTDVEIMPETTFTGISGENIVNATTSNFTAGTNCIVTWNGVDYECVIQSSSINEDMLSAYVGNGNMLGGVKTDDPFLFAKLTPAGAAQVGGGYILYTMDGSTTVTMKIMEPAGAVHQLDKKFIPSDLMDGYVPVLRTINGKYLKEDISLKASDVGAVPTTRTVNNKTLSSDITLSATDVGALPSTTVIPSIEGLATETYVDEKVAGKVDKTITVNGKALSSNITLAASDVGALPSSTVIPSIEGLATETYVDEKVASIEIPSIEGLATETYVNEKASTKVDKTTTINGKALSSSIALSANDVNADPSGSANTALANAKSYTDTKISDLINSAPTTLDTLGEIATAMAENEDVVAALEDSIGTKANANDLTSHTGNKSNPHGVTLSQLGVTATATELNYVDGVTSNVQTQLNAKVPTDRTVNGKALSSNVTLSASDIGAVSTTTKVGLSGGVTGTATTFGNSTNVTIPVTDIKESYMSWGGQNLLGKLSPFDDIIAGSVTNCFAFLPLNGITTEYTRDGGTTWTSMSSTTGLFLPALASGTLSITKPYTTNDKIRVTIDNSICQQSSSLKKLLFHMYCIGVEAQVVVEYFYNNNLQSTRTFPLSGSWNSIAASYTFYPAYKLRFTFEIINLSEHNNPSFSVKKIVGIGEIISGSNMAKTGELYAYDENQNAIFPAQISATQFTENGKALASKTYVDEKASIKVDKTTTINGKALSSNITLSASDVGADTAGTAQAKIDELYIKNGKAVALRTEWAEIESSTYSLGENAIALGSGSKASGYSAYAEGGMTIASGSYSHAEGHTTIANDNFSHAEGYKTTANNQSTHAEGEGTIASGFVSHAEGYTTIAGGSYSHAEGYTTIASGNYSHAEGGQNGLNITLTGEANSVEYICDSGHVLIGRYIRNNTNGIIACIIAVNINSDGQKVITLDQTLSNEALINKSMQILLGAACGAYSHTEGNGSFANGHSSHAEGEETITSGSYSHAEGYRTIASSDASHAEGEETIASGAISHAEGYYTMASGSSSHAEGSKTQARSNSSHAEGYGTITTVYGIGAHVQGKYNIVDTGDKYAHIVGNGESDTARSNAHTLDWQGNAWFQGNVYVGGTNQDEGSEKLLTQSEVNSIINELLAAILPTPTIEDAGKVLRVNEEGKYELVAPLTNEEIDDICGSTVQVSSEMVDEATGESYRLYVSNGELKMEKVV